MINEIGEKRIELLRNCIAFSKNHKIPCIVKLSVNNELGDGEIKLVIQNAEDEKTLELLVQIDPKLVLDTNIITNLLYDTLDEIFVDKRICEITMQRQFGKSEDLDYKIQVEHPEINDHNYSQVIGAIMSILKDEGATIAAALKMEKYLKENLGIK